MTTTLEDGDSRSTTVLRRKAAAINTRGRRSTGPLHSPASSAADLSPETDASLQSQWLAAIVEGSDDAIISKTMGGMVNYWNAAATRIFGFTAKEMIGAPITRIIPDELQGEEAEILAKLARGERIDHFETVRLRKDGRQVAVSLAVSPLRDAAGKVIGASKIARDITERKRVENELIETNERFTIGSKAAGLAFWIYDFETRRTISWDDQMLRLYGVTREEAQTYSALAFRFIHPDDRARLEAEVQEASNDARDLDIEYRIIQPSGRLRHLKVAGSRKRDSTGRVVRLVGVTLDITERKETEDALRSANEALRKANEVAQRLRIEAENANRAKTDFLAVMSHEIRTPLTSISGFVDLLTRAGKLTRQQRRYVELVKIANAALLAIVNDILDFSKVEAGQLELERRAFALKALIHNTSALAGIAATEKNLLLDYTIARDVPEWLIGDHARLRQVLLNLLNNAIKFTQAGSISLDVRRDVASDGGDRIRFSVTDTGIGIAAEQQYRLFKKFSQADSSINRQHGGTGLGLAICKRLVELMDGEIGVVSEAGKGATVWFTARLPVASKPPIETDSEVPRQQPGSDNAHILVVDDLNTNREIIEAYLEDSGYRVDSAGSAVEAIEMLASEPFDLVLMDIQMPNMDGVAATQRIRQLPPPIRDIPIIAMTGNVLPRQVKSFLQAGMNDHVGKPIERAKLHNSIRRWLPGTKGRWARVRSASSHSDNMRFEEFVGVVGAEKAERIATGFLDELKTAFPPHCTLSDAQRAAHALVNCAGVLGMENLVAACRALQFVSRDDVNHQIVAMDELRREQSLARQTLMGALLPRLRDRLLLPTG